MPLNYHYVSEEELKMRSLLPKGTYTFTIKKAEAARNSADTSDMLIVDLVIQHMNSTHYLRDWIVFSEKMAWKFRNLAASCGLLDKYEAKTLEASDFLEKKGGVKVKTDNFTGNDGNDRLVNKVEDYVAMPEVDQTLSDDIPF